MAIYACADLHGFMDLYKQIKEYLNPEDTVYYLGDAGDRGPNSWELIKTIFNDEQFIYLKGNHEDMLCGAGKDFLRDPDRLSHDYRLLVRNGGADTFDGWASEKDKEKWLKKLDRLPTYKIYKNQNGTTIILSHAGFTPFLNKNTRRFEIPTNEELIWGREHIYEDWDELHFSDHLIVHGHTPSAYLHNAFCKPFSEFQPGAYRYCDGYKICVDCGTYSSGMACLLNLDTLEDVLFTLSDDD